MSIKCHVYEHVLVWEYPGLPGSVYVQKEETVKQSGSWSSLGIKVRTADGDCEAVKVYTGKYMQRMETAKTVGTEKGSQLDIDPTRNCRIDV